jgi:histidine triad (HIT) family protein
MTFRPNHLAAIVELMTHPSGIKLPVYGPCPFCAYLAGTDRCAFVTRTRQVAAIVNIRQYERGAMLVIPTDHQPTVFDLGAELLAAVYAEAARVGAAAVRAFGATGLNIYQNNGTPAGQSIPHHHIHVVPRYATSERTRHFHETDFAPVPFDEQLSIAEAIRGMLQVGSAK